MMLLIACWLRTSLDTQGTNIGTICSPKSTTSWHTRTQRLSILQGPVQESFLKATRTYLFEAGASGWLTPATAKYLALWHNMIQLLAITGNLFKSANLSKGNAAAWTVPLALENQAAGAKNVNLRWCYSVYYCDWEREAFGIISTSTDVKKIPQGEINHNSASMSLEILFLHGQVEALASCKL
ncbi:hypothetical protein GALMADRAFT_1195679 [Galerina marginata CBS 339.88]|uniref:Uncharacterized protein n=1 Tax=Galerina marginata (strain CBS 339.88) TaxID=685588 RepID=A0A067TKF7_GALM3|nr:hypothetical protein GALMADRAFT_1195679 [Galerina marginata CBS 339.88]